MLYYLKNGRRITTAFAINPAPKYALFSRSVPACTPRAFPAERESRFDQGHACSPEHGIFRCRVNNQTMNVHGPFRAILCGISGQTGEIRLRGIPCKPSLHADKKLPQNLLAHQPVVV
jgi:hypothetical protein